MTRVFLLTCWFCGLVGGALAQNPAPTSVLLLDTLPPQGLLLEKGWRIHRGDNPAWARPAFDDRSWARIDLNSNRSPNHKPQIPREGIGWLRLRFRLSDSLWRQPLTLSVDQRVASELYVNGRLLRRYGTVSAQPDRVVPYGDNPEPIEVHFDRPGEQVLAVRFAVWPPITRFSDNFYHFLLRIRLSGVAQAISAVRSQQAAQLPYLAVAVVFLLLSLLHLAFFRYNPGQRANAYFALYTLTGMVGFGCLFAAHYTHDVRLGLVLFVVFYTLNQTGWMGAVRALYALFAVPVGWVYYGLWACLLIGIPLFFFGSLGIAPYAVPVILILAEQLRLTIWALIRRKRGAGIVATGFAVTLGVAIGSSLYYAFVAHLTAGQLSTIFSIGFLSPVISISLFLGREFALDSQLLQLKLTEVQQLSARTLAQEQEKQQLLAAQNETLERQVDERTAALKQSLETLKTTQSRLIQKEKMASLGELTAGIAHEIQNPLNFVNNFAEVSAELADELAEGLKGIDRPEVLALSVDLRQNMEHIVRNGQRAASIVRSMLEHSRSNSNVRQPTDVNALASEYLKLAYNGIKGRGNGFDVQVVTDFDPTLATVNLAAQEIGQVLLNVYNNAFYAVAQQQKQTQQPYEPTVHVGTRQRGNMLELYIRDNGTGIPEAVRGKIFQPFFTTKPTGEGTGLGLSLSYDIISGGYGGEIYVDSRVGQYTEFKIELPLGQA